MLLSSLKAPYPKHRNFILLVTSQCQCVTRRCFSWARHPWSGIMNKIAIWSKLFWWLYTICNLITNFACFVLQNTCSHAYVLSSSEVMKIVCFECWDTFPMRYNCCKSPTERNCWTYPSGQTHTLKIITFH